jgi:hypothetical protein
VLERKDSMAECYQQLIILIGNDFNSKFSELPITIRKKNVVVPCPKRGNVAHALSEARW